MLGRGGMKRREPVWVDQDITVSCPTVKAALWLGIFPLVPTVFPAGGLVNLGQIDN